MKKYRAVIYKYDNGTKIFIFALIGQDLKAIYKAAKSEVKKRQTNCEIFSNGKLICVINY